MAHEIQTLALGTGASIGLAVLALLVGIGAGVLAYRAMTGASLRSAKAEGDQLLSKAKGEADTIRERAAIEAEKKALAEREKAEAEAQAQRNELREQERRLTKREDMLDRKLDTLTTKEEFLTGRGKELDERERDLTSKHSELDALIEREKKALVEVSGLSIDDARQTLLDRVEEDVKLDTDRIVRQVVEKADETAHERSREIILNAIQRYAAEHTSEATVRAVPIPSDEMKGRIIGREGRNIRAIEKVTGVDIIVDDTPGVIIVSCFDKVRQAVAVEALTRLVADGRMHPTRIEEVVEKVRKEINERIMKDGKDAVMEVKLRNVHPKVTEAMGKLTFRTSYGQNVLRHSVEVAYLCQIIADQLGLDGRLARRCGFLHDIGKAMDHEMEGGHPKIGADFAKQYGENEIVLNAIEGHHGDVPSTSFYTPIVMAADAVSSARPGARRESMERYIQRLNQLQDIALEHDGVTEAHAIQAGREVRVMVDARSVSDDRAHSIAYDIAKRVSDEMTFPGEIRVTVLRETRAVELAR